MTPERAAELVRRADFPFEPTVKKVLVHLLDRVEALEKEVAECRTKTSSESEQSSAKTADGPATESPKPARQTGSRSKRSAGGSTARSATS
jgi:hypothetical protein